MFDIGWTEMLVIAVVMIVVVGPKDLPRMLRTFGKMTTKVRGMAGDFQKQFNDALKEAELDDVKKSVDALRGLNPTAEIKKHLNPFEKAAADVRAGLETAMKPKPSTSEQPASPVTHEAEPLKSGASDMPGVPAPEALPATPPAGLMTSGISKPAIMTPVGPPEIPAPIAAPAPKKPRAAAAKPVAVKPVASKAVAAAAVAKSKTPAVKPATTPVAKPAPAAAKPVAAPVAKPAPATSSRKPAAPKVAATAPATPKRSPRKSNA